MAFRIEHDSLGPVEVPAERLWGAQTQRSLHFFAISSERCPPAFVQALARVKQACARVNAGLGELDPGVADAIIAAAQEVMDGQWADEFPLSIWQTGSGTQSNMNMNEVLAHRASQLLVWQPVHPNDQVNRNQSSNDIFPTAMHVALAGEIAQALLPALDGLAATLQQKSADDAHIVKIGRTHLQDATPLTVGQEM